MRRVLAEGLAQLVADLVAAGPDARAERGEQVLEPRAAGDERLDRRAPRSRAAVPRQPAWAAATRAPARVDDQHRQAVGRLDPDQPARRRRRRPRPPPACPPTAPRRPSRRGPASAAAAAARPRAPRPRGPRVSSRDSAAGRLAPPLEAVHQPRHGGERRDDGGAQAWRGHRPIVAVAAPDARTPRAGVDTLRCCVLRCSRAGRAAARRDGVVASAVELVEVAEVARLLEARGAVRLHAAPSSPTPAPARTRRAAWPRVSRPSAPRCGCSGGVLASATSRCCAAQYGPPALRLSPRAAGAAATRSARRGARQPHARARATPPRSWCCSRDDEPRGARSPGSLALAARRRHGGAALPRPTRRPATPRPHPFNHDRNAVWLEHRWLERGHSEAAMEELFRRLRGRGVIYLYPHLIPFDGAGQPAAARPRADARLPGGGAPGRAGAEDASLGRGAARRLPAPAGGHAAARRPQPAAADRGRGARPGGRGLRRRAPQRRARRRRQRRVPRAAARAAHGGGRRAPAVGRRDAPGPARPAARAELRLEPRLLRARGARSRTRW